MTLYHLTRVSNLGLLGPFTLDLINKFESLRPRKKGVNISSVLLIESGGELFVTDRVFH